jgi:HrpA-like RNA helicase
MSLPTLYLPGNLVPTNKKDNLSSVIPIDFIIDWFSSRLERSGIENRVLILKSDTGSGKSTVFPAELYKRIYMNNRRARIAVTQPRVLTTISIVREQLVGSGYYPFLKLGENIGWKTGVSKKNTNTGLIYMTIDSLAVQLQTLSDQQIMDTYNVIILDEVHELSLGLLMVIYMLKQFMLRNSDNPKLPFIVATSATFDANKYKNYFNVDVNNVINVTGSTYPKYEHFIDGVSMNYVTDIAKLAVKIHMQNLKDDPTQADILAFVPGKSEGTLIRQFLDKENSLLAKNNEPVFMPLYIDREVITSSGSDYASVFMPPDKLSVYIDDKYYSPVRRIILSTNVAETGLTIDTLKYVIESGISREVEYFPTNGAYALISKPVTISRHKQRIGRVGRKFPGYYYTLYSKNVLNDLLDNQFSELITSDMSRFILPILSEQFKTLCALKHINILTSTTDMINGYDPDKIPPINMENIDLLEKIPSDTLHEQFEKLYTLGFITPHGKSNIKLTKIGLMAARLDLRPESARMLLASYAWKCSAADIASIAAFLELTISAKVYKSFNWAQIYYDALPKTYSKSLTPTEWAIKIRLLFADEFMDGMFLMRAIQFQASLETNYNILDNVMNFCKIVNIPNYKLLLEFIKLRDNILDKLVEVGFNPFQHSSLFTLPEEMFNDTVVKIKHCIYEGFRLNVMTYNINSDNYTTRMGLTTKGPSLFLDVLERANLNFTYTEKPKKVLYSKLALKMNKKTSVYDVFVDRFSTLDGFVNFDDDFITPFDKMK